MASRKEMTDHLFRLVHIARSAGIKRALTLVEPEPNLNFWRLILGNQLDTAVLEWCKVFGTDDEPTHWKKVVPPENHNQFRDRLFEATGTTSRAWAVYWGEMTTYRNLQVAHHIELNPDTNYPVLDIALKSSYCYYDYLIKELRSLGETRYPDNLQSYYELFTHQAREIASKAISSTAAIIEQVY